MTEGFVALMVTLIGASAGAMGMLAKWVTDRLDRRPRPGDIEITLSERIVDLVEAVYPGPRGLTSPQGPQGLPGVNAVNAVASYLVDHGSETCTGSTCPSAAITKVENDHSRA